MNKIGVEFSRFNEVLDFGDCDFGGGRHHGIKIARGFAIDEVAPLIALPCLHEGEVGVQSALHEVGASIELSYLFALGDNCADSCGREEGGNAGASGSNALGKSTLRHEVEVHGTVEDHLLEQSIFADVGSDVMCDLAVGEKQSHAKAIDSDVIADGMEILHAFVGESADQIFGHPAEAESADHDGGSVENVLDRVLGAGNYFVHGTGIL